MIDATEIANKMVNDNIAKAIADKMMQILRHKAEIKKLERQIEQIKNGERVPGEIKSSEQHHIKLMLPKPVSDIYRPWQPMKPYISSPYNKYRCEDRHSI